MNQVTEFLHSLEFREQFVVRFTPEFQKHEGYAEEYIAWVEGFNPSAETIQLFYDDGDELNEWYPEILCHPNDIESLSRI